MIKICCLGAGYVGGPTMSVIAEKNPQTQVTVVDTDSTKITAWNSDNLPVYEEGLLAIVQKQRGKNLFFSTDIAQHLSTADIIFISVGTPTKTYGIGSGSATNLNYVESAAHLIADHCTTPKIVVEKSTVPVRTGEIIQNIFRSHHKEHLFHVLSNPEFLAEGTAISDLHNPDRILIGGNDQASVEKLIKVYSSWVPHERIVTTNLWSSELSKLTANAFLAQRISSINSISALCEKSGANIEEIVAAISKDSRIGEKFLQPSVGFGGSCFQKDILNLVYLCRHFGLQEVADYWQQVVTINNYQKNRFAHNIIYQLFNCLLDKKIAVLGFAFKKDTNDARETPAVDVIRTLTTEGAKIHVYDPKVSSTTIKTMLDGSPVTIAESIDSAIQDAHAIVILTEWDCFRQINYQQAFQKMAKPAHVFDGRNILNHEELQQIGFQTYSIGKGKN